VDTKNLEITNVLVTDIANSRRMWQTCYFVLLEFITISVVYYIESDEGLGNHEYECTLLPSELLFCLSISGILDFIKRKKWTFYSIL